MESTLTEEAPKVDVKEPTKPIGEVILGRADPRKLTEAEFNDSPDILYHGAGKPFDFSKDFSYEEFDNPHSSTLGTGLYLTPNKKDAELFSEAFGAKEPIVIPFLPLDAKMYDFRAAGETGRKNAPVPVEMLREWSEYYRKFYDRQYANYIPDWDKRPLDRKAVVMVNFTNYLNYVNRLDRIGKPVDLRKMLGLYGDSSLSDMVGDLWSRLMLENGYDGVIYIEGGDHPEHWNTQPASYVFYNLDKIGTYKAWHDADSE